jgi:hypothetical protein
LRAVGHDDFAERYKRRISAALDRTAEAERGNLEATRELRRRFR